MISITNATYYNSIHNTQTLPSPTAILFGHKVFVDGFVFECKICEGSYAWVIENSSERLYASYDVSASENGHVTAYICGAPHCKYYSLYLGGSGACADYNTTLTPPWFATYGGKIERCYVSSGITKLGQLMLYRESSLVSISGMSGVIGIANYCFGLALPLCTALKQFVPDYGFDGLHGNGTLKNTPLTYVCIPDSASCIGNEAFSKCTSLTHMYIPSTVETISAHWSIGEAVNASPFFSCSSNLIIYCGASSKPAAWGTYWNYYANGGTLTVKWGYTRAQYESEVGI